MNFSFQEKKKEKETRKSFPQLGFRPRKRRWEQYINYIHVRCQFHVHMVYMQLTPEYLNLQMKFKKVRVLVSYNYRGKNYKENDLKGKKHSL